MSSYYGLVPAPSPDPAPPTRPAPAEDTAPPPPGTQPQEHQVGSDS